MPRKSSPYRVVLKQHLMEPQLMQGQSKDGNPILIVHFQLTEDEPILLKSFSLNFVSVEHMMSVMSPIMDKAAEMWPDHPLMQEYMNE